MGHIIHRSQLNTAPAPLDDLSRRTWDVIHTHHVRYQAIADASDTLLDGCLIFLRRILQKELTDDRDYLERQLCACLAGMSAETTGTVTVRCIANLSVQCRQHVEAMGFELQEDATCAPWDCTVQSGSKKVTANLEDTLAQIRRQLAFNKRHHEGTDDDH